MLETVKHKIESGFRDFDQYYLDYICSVQDNNIDREFRYFKSSNILNPMSMQQIIESTYKELNILDFNK